MKRALRQSNGGEDAAASRAKRRKETAAPVAGSSSDIDIDALGEDEHAPTRPSSAPTVREQGAKLWQTIRDATNKEGRILSADFYRRPPRKLYPDYYVVIQHPIALEDIKKHLETDFYPTLEAVRQDFELCFENAKTYNMEGSGIWKDAKDLLKLTNKTYHKMVPSVEEGEPTGKQPSVHRLAKSRLNKIIEKTDENGRVLSEIFMELPSRKLWPQYYVQIKQPQCLDAILKRVKHKDYGSMTEFADDVELVFSNAMEFNLEHSPIWEDALLLRNAFRQLMSDLPPPFTVPRYQKTSTAKIKIKMPALAAAAAAGTPSSPPAATNAPSAPPVKLRVPGAAAAKAPTPVLAAAPLPTPTPPPPAAKASPGLLPNTLPSSHMIQTSSQTHAQPQAQAQAQTQTHTHALTRAQTLQPQPTHAATIIPTFSHYPQASYLPPAAPIPIAAPVAAPPPPPPPVVHPPPKNLSLSNSPAPPPIHPSHMLKGVSLMTEPCKRPFILDHRDGVKTWAMRLGPAERAISVADITYMGDDEEDSSEDEDEDMEEEEEDDSDDSDAVGKNGKKKGKGKGRTQGRSRAAITAAKAAQAARAAKREARKIKDVQVKLNGLVVSEKTDHPGHWFVDLQKGANVLEVGEKDGLIWRVYADRPLV